MNSCEFHHSTSCRFCAILHYINSRLLPHWKSGTAATELLLPVIDSQMWGSLGGWCLLGCVDWLLRIAVSPTKTPGFYRQTLPSKPGIGSTLFCRLSHGEISPTTCSWDETPENADVVRYGWWCDSCLICYIHVYSKNIMVKTGENWWSQFTWNHQQKEDHLSKRQRAHVFGMFSLFGQRWKSILFGSCMRLNLTGA